MGAWPLISGRPTTAPTPPATRAATPGLARPPALDRGRSSSRSRWSPAPGCSAPPTTPSPVWAVATDMGAGRRGRPPTTWSRRRVRFADAGDLAGYFTADDELPADLRADPRRRRRRAAAARRGRAPRAQRRHAAGAGRRRRRAGAAARCRPGSVVDVYLGRRRARCAGTRSAAARRCPAVTVVDAPAARRELRPPPASGSWCWRCDEQDATRVLPAARRVRRAPCITVVRRG